MKDMGLRPEIAMDRDSGGVASWGESLTHISAEIMNIKRVVVVVVVPYNRIILPFGSDNIFSVTIQLPFLNIISVTNLL